METTWTAPNGDRVTDPTGVLTEEQLEFLYGEYGSNANLMINNAYDVALVNANSLGVDADDFAQTKIFQLYNDSMVGVDQKQTSLRQK